jgi:hypothetical protein
VRQALDYRSTARAVGVCVLGWIIHGIILAILFNVFGRDTMLENEPIST